MGPDGSRWMKLRGGSRLLTAGRLPTAQRTCLRHALSVPAWQPPGCRLLTFSRWLSTLRCLWMRTYLGHFTSLCRSFFGGGALPTPAGHKGHASCCSAMVAACHAEVDCIQDAPNVFGLFSNRGSACLAGAAVRLTPAGAAATLFLGACNNKLAHGEQLGPEELGNRTRQRLHEGVQQEHEASGPAADPTMSPEQP